MSLEEDDRGDLSLANLSVLTASMSFEEQDSEPDHDLLDSDAEPELIEAPPVGSRRESPKLESRPASPPPERHIEPEDQLISDFYLLAHDVVDPSVIGGAAKFAVIISSLGYKHVFSRPWVSKRSLSTVVEKPERLKAACIGVGLAQTKVPLKLLRSTRRTSLYVPHFEKVHGKDWATQLYALCSAAASNLSKKELEVPESWPYYDIYLAPETIEALEGNVAALESGVDEIFGGSDVRRSFVIMRPPGHHCHEDAASGFCIINNAHIAIQYARAAHDITHAVILDFDLHHGDGSQDLTWKLGFKSEGPADLPIGYFSLHDINSFPCEAGYAQPQQIAEASVCFVAHHCAMWNVHLKPYETVAEFNEIYATEYSVLFRKAAQFLDQCRQECKLKSTPFKPLIVLSAGFDGSEFEGQGMQRHQVNVPTSFYNRFTRDSIALAENYGDGHLISLLEGGYSATAVATGVFSHLTGLAEVPYNESEWCPVATTPHEIDWGMRQRWRVHPEKWTSRGIQLARALFPAVERSDSVKPDPYATQALPGVEHGEKRRLRSRTAN